MIRLFTSVAPDSTPGVDPFSFAVQRSANSRSVVLSAFAPNSRRLLRYGSSGIYVEAGTAETR